MAPTSPREHARIVYRATSLLGLVGSMALFSACEGFIVYQDPGSTIVSTGYAVVRDSVEGEQGWGELRLFPRSLDDEVIIDRKDTEYGSEIHIEGKAGEGRRINLWTAVVSAAAGFLAGGAAP